MAKVKEKVTTMEIKPVVFNYADWLVALQPGDNVYTGYETGVVYGVLEDSIAIAVGDKVSYYSAKNGRQQGQKAGQYLPGILAPYTEARRKDDETKAANEAKRLADRELLDMKQETAESFLQAMGFSDTYNYSCSTNKLTKLSHDVLERYLMAIRVVNQEMFGSDNHP